MAQPIFEEHPLQDYLRQSGDIFEPIPGAISGLACPFSDACGDEESDHDLKLCSWLTPPSLRLAEFFNIVVTSVQNHHSTLQEFSERFKYDVISSSLLASSITAPSSTRRRSSSLDDSLSDDLDPNPTTQLPPPAPSQPAAHRSPARLISLFGLFLISVFFDSFLLYVFIVTVLFYLESYALVSGHVPAFIPPTFNALKDLIAAAHLWDSTVNEAINLLQLEESIAPSSPPSSPLRVALHSALLSTQTQSDNVRHVLVGLTSSSSLAQLSEMYAPPSPKKPLTPLHARSGSATTGSRMSTVSTPPSDKRATWNGSIPFSYAALAEAGSPSRQSLRRWEKRRSDLSALLLHSSGVVMSAPTTPQPRRSLAGVEEETANHFDLSVPPEQEDDDDAAVPPEERGEFGSAALELQRQRRTKGMEAFLPATCSPPPKYAPTSPQPPLSPHIIRFGSKSSHSNPTSPRSSSSASRFTAMQIPRHPLSLHALTFAINGAVAARRYAASHLLALRFGGGDSLNDTERASESYWEDVRAVMGLLTTALANATAPLIEALDATERERLRTENPTPSSRSHSRPSSPLEPSTQATLRLSQPQEQQQLRRRRQVHRSSSHFASFAPLPTHLTRFATHVEALTNALNDARENLESCVASLRDRDPTSISYSAEAHRDASIVQQDAKEPTLQAYERLRRELGLALRECERGREPLLELLRPPSAEDEDEEEDEEDRVPALGLDPESSDSEKDAAPVRSPSPSSFFSLPTQSERTNAVLVQGTQQNVDEEDAVHAHGLERGASGVLVVGLERLPPPGGIEQVFEADPDADEGEHRLARPRSKLSRAERIAIAKARRANPIPNPISTNLVEIDEDGDRDGATRRWAGPGGDVVQELKDVIWKVGEQRRLRERRLRKEVVGSEAEEAEVEAEVEAEGEADSEVARRRQLVDGKQQIVDLAQTDATTVAIREVVGDVFTSSSSSSSPTPTPPSPPPS